MKLTVKAPAKINWSLSICGDRPDGYHDLDMLMQSIELSDVLTFETSRWLTLDVNGQRLPSGDRNLVIRAANALNDTMGKHFGAHITLKKHIPSRAGLGGGSADCAATLLALNHMWNLHLPLKTLQQIGLSLGADVPFCLQRGLCRAQGVGEILTPREDAPVIPLAMITPGGGLSTPAVFKAWNAGGYPMTPVETDALADALLAGDLDRAQELAHNDLEAPAISLMPEIGELIERFRSLGARFVRMTGSGSTVFAAFDSDEAARAAVAAVPGSIFTRTAGRS
ncbi:MAG: 4-(cytidine 5'-diphospho)-2-C-methyl-D-erythritol kinase [Clostridia bacterium]|nr:4-(cytidine 5'-diphospho)-2-C-methyl-D-erythritol kinase [Clostridia bacterium]MBP3653797.1 4-(cytidine 5'-diphospho)-2-C-methyl-D-erythritol kinase [Clostridia bacterium]